MSIKIHSGDRRSRFQVGAFFAELPDNTHVLPSGTGCRLGSETEACFNGRTTITLEAYLKGEAPVKT